MTDVPQSSPMQQHVYDKILELLSLPEDTCEFDLVIAIVRLTDKPKIDPHSLFGPTIRTAAPTPYRKDLNADQ